MAEDKSNKTDVLKEVVKDVYTDVGHPVAKPTGELVGLVPRAVKAALAPLEKWIVQREYNVAETQKLLEEKLKTVPSELIQPPEAHIAVPAIQYISYCMDNEELRNMYANLLANSMNKIVKNDVHPGFVEIIKQLCPDEAKILRGLYSEHTIPTITVRYENADESGVTVFKHFSDIAERSECEAPGNISGYFDNLVRLGLLECSPVLSSLSDKSLYDPLKAHHYIQDLACESKIKESGFIKVNLVEGYMSLTKYGMNFCSICVAPIKIVTTTQE